VARLNFLAEELTPRKRSWRLECGVVTRVRPPPGACGVQKRVEALRSTRRSVTSRVPRDERKATFSAGRRAKGGRGSVLAAGLEAQTYDGNVWWPCAEFPVPLRARSRYQTLGSPGWRSWSSTLLVAPNRVKTWGATRNPEAC